LQLLERQLAQTFTNIGLVWNPYNVPVQNPPPWPAASGVWKLACVARLEPKAKGQDLLFQVCSQTKWRERPIKVNMYGAGPCESSLKRLAGMLQANNVQFCGHVADISKIWAENHMLVLPSRLEGLPLALVESMWCARPSVVTDVGGNAELCVDGETGFVAAAPTLGLFDETLERAWTRRDHWQVMGCAARARAEKLIPKAPIEEFCRQLMECLERHKTT
jgi:glycosyltransferase involved in cell wall biosynthesis